MSKKQSHMARSYAVAAGYLAEKKGRAVSAGEVAKYLGVSRTTARKYLEIARWEKLVDWVSAEHFNGVMAIGYTSGIAGAGWK